MKLDAYLADRGLTQAAFAARIGVSGPTVHRWIAGKARPDWTALGAIERETAGAVTYRDFQGTQAPSGMAKTQVPLADEARALGLDPEAIAAKAVEDAVRAEKARRWREENKDAIAAWNDWTEQNKLPLAKYRMF
jgi:post-segregation antitoxin (ccd killing protein)/DNA-binding XRE family transcriptional regulator